MEPSSWLEHLPSERRRAIAELVQGREMTLQLRNLLHSSTDSNGSEALSQDLVAKILNSFTNTLSILKSNGESDEVSPHTHLGWDAPVKSEDSGDSSKSTTVKDRRGCYKRRKSTEIRTTQATSLVDDGHAWRKYGQKVILNAKFPRNYFRCTHKHDQGCQATKQVQQIEENPPLFRSIYYGHHTCKNLLKATQLLVDSPSKDRSSMISFGSHISERQNNPFFSSFSSIKQEHKDEIPSDMTHNDPSSSSDYLLSPDELTTFESTGHMTVLSSDHGDVLSGVNSSCNSNLEMSIMGVDSDSFIDDVILEYF